MQRRAFLLTSAALVFPARAISSDPHADAQAALWDALRAGGIAILLRHAATEPGIGDPPGYRIGDCKTQRNLSDAGRTQAARIALTLAEKRVKVDSVLSSRRCRCLETARLAFPQLTVEPAPAFDSFFDARDKQGTRTAAARARIAKIRPPANVAFVTHQVNIAALTGHTVAVGEAILVRADETRFDVLGRLLIT